MPTAGVEPIITCFCGVLTTAGLMGGFFACDISSKLLKTFGAVESLLTACELKLSESLSSLISDCMAMLRSLFNMLFGDMCFLIGCDLFIITGVAGDIWLVLAAIVGVLEVFGKGRVRGRPTKKTKSHY